MDSQRSLDGSADEQKDYVQSVDDDIERAFQAIGKWISLKLREATLKEVVEIALGIYVAVIGTIALCVYSGQLKAMNHSNQTAQDSLRRSISYTRTDLRAWIEIEPIKPRPYKKSRDVYVYDLFPKNVGKTAARDIVVRADNFAANRESIENTKHADWIHNWQDSYLLGKFKGNGPLNRGTPVPSVLGPNAMSPIPVTYLEEAPQFFPAGAEMVSEIIGRIDYTDEFGIRHWLRFCFYPADSDGDLATCVAGNDQDHNPELPPTP